MVWRSISNKALLLLITLLLATQVSLGQIGHSYTESLPDNQPTHEDPGFYVSEAIILPDVKCEQPFIAVSGKINTYLSEENISLWIRSKNETEWSPWMALQPDEHQHSDEQILYFIPWYLPPQTSVIQAKITSSLTGPIEARSFDLRVYFPGEACLNEKVSEHDLTDQHQNEHGLKSLNCSCPIPGVELRNDWCPSGNCPKDQTPTPTTVSHLVVHHSAGSNSSPDWAATVRSIWDYHVNVQGWDDIGYNYLIDPNGVIYEGRGNDVQGAHFSCMNTGTMGVCLLGNFSQVAPTTPMINSLTELLGWKACDIDQDPRDTSFFANGAVDLVNLVGHRDGNNIPASCTVTECPGDNVYAIMGNLRNAVYNYSQSCTLAPSYSNIVILAMNTLPSVVYEDSAILLNVDFRNSGAADINESLSIDFRLDNQSVGTANFNILNAGQSDNRQLPYLFTDPGNYNFCAYIDAASNEINTSNNSFCVSIEVLEKSDSSVTGIRTIEDGSLRIYPNPSSDLFWVESERTIEALRVYTALGRLVLSTIESPLDLSQLPAGMYYLHIQYQEDVVALPHKLIKH